MQKYKSVLWQELNLRVGSLRIRDIALHRHLPEITSLGEHRHRFSQLLLYLAGHGVQRVGENDHAVSAGTLAAIPANVPHSFTRSGKRPALCLVVDFSLGKRGRTFSVTEMNALALGEIRETLAKIARIPEGSDLPWQVLQAALALRLVEPMLQASGWFGAPKTQYRSPIVRRMETLLRCAESGQLSVRELAGKIGYQPDYLNRMLKSETGLTLGQWRSRQRISRAKVALKSDKSIGDVAEWMGFSDQNYFARWFREQTGKTPTQWKTQPF